MTPSGPSPRGGVAPPPGDAAGSPTLLERVGRGDASAVRPLVDAYGGFVWSVVRARFPAGQHQQDAEEVVQDVFASIWKDAARFDPAKGSEKTFIAVIARRRVVDRLRKLGVSQESAVEAHLLDVRLDERDDRDRSGQADDVRKAALALENLPQPQRMVLRLFIVSGHTHEQISAATGVPLGTVKSHIRRGLARVREEVQAGERATPGHNQQGQPGPRGAAS